VGNWLVGEHANAVAAVLEAVIGNCDSFLCGKEMAKKWPKHGIMGAPPVQKVRGSFYL
jgi:hypothetical protein